MPKLGVNIDHVATVRQARGEHEPDPLEAALMCEKAGADSIVCHLREDRRHILDADVKNLRRKIKTRLNLEMSLNKDIVAIAVRLKPDHVTLVPEKRQELTTEGGLNVIGSQRRIKRTIKIFKRKNIPVSLFIDPVKAQIKCTKDVGADMIELHTGVYANARTRQKKTKELQKLKASTQYALKLGLTVNAGHGLKYHDTRAVARIRGMKELNIGHSIISRAIFVGLPRAVKEMKALCK